MRSGVSKGFSLEGLDYEQKEAVFSKALRLLVVAPPGSGKTRVLTCRYMRLLGGSVRPPEILAVTFTNRAAREMKERIFSMSGGPMDGVAIGTFHKTALSIIRKVRDVRIITRQEQKDLLKGLGIKGVESALDSIGRIKNSAVEPTPEENETFSVYRKALLDRGLSDLDDLVPEAHNLIKKDPGLVPFRHVMVDEYQDINPVQSEFLGLLSENSSLMAIGDPDQAIYSFRGSSLRCFLEFGKEYPGSTVITLKRNYRSRSSIVRSSGSLIRNNTARVERGMESMCDGGAVTVVACADERSEADFIIKEIESLMGGFTNLSAGDHSEGFRFSDIAVLFRTNRQAEAVAAAFSRSFIPFHVVTPPGPALAGFISRLKNAQAVEGQSLTEFVSIEGRKAGMDEDLLGNIIHCARLYGDAPAAQVIENFIEELVLTGQADNIDIDADKVNIMTIHMAKGLEFRAVFMAGVEDGLIPLKMKGSETDMEEERRLFYVAMTRAKQDLYLIHADKRKAWGEIKEASPSPFLKELPVSGLKKKAVEEKKPKKRAEQKGLFD